MARDLAFGVRNSSWDTHKKSWESLRVYVEKASGVSSILFMRPTVPLLA